MNRTELLEHLCLNNNIDKCCNEIKSINCKECDEVINAYLDEYDKHVIEEHFAKIMSFINTSNRGNSDYFIIDQIENYIIEQLKEITENDNGRDKDK